MVRYQAIKEQLQYPSHGAYTAWGIQGWQLAERSWSMAVHISDVFLNEQEAVEFAKLCTEAELAAVHLADVIEDRLAGATYK